MDTSNKNELYVYSKKFATADVYQIKTFISWAMGGTKWRLLQNLVKIFWDSVCPARSSDTFKPIAL